MYQPLVLHHCCHHRLIKHTEDQHLRAPTQRGYCPHLSTVHQALVLQHSVGKNHMLVKTLYLCFIDITAAYSASCYLVSGERQGVRHFCILRSYERQWTSWCAHSPSVGLRQVVH